MAKYYRTQVLLEPDQHRLLSELALRENRSLSDLLREIVQRYIDEQRRASEMEALDTLSQKRAEIRERKGVYSGDLVNEAREERDNELFHVIRGEDDDASRQH